MADSSPSTPLTVGPTPIPPARPLWRSLIPVPGWLLVCVGLTAFGRYALFGDAELTLRQIFGLTLLTAAGCAGFIAGAIIMSDFMLAALRRKAIRDAQREPQS